MKVRPVWQWRHQEDWRCYSCHETSSKESCIQGLAPSQERDPLRYTLNAARMEGLSHLSKHFENQVLDIGLGAMDLVFSLLVFSFILAQYFLSTLVSAFWNGNVHWVLLHIGGMSFFF